MRPRLALLADLGRDLTRAARSRLGARQPESRRPPAAEREPTAEERKRRLDETRERLKRETPRQPDDR
jgi:hypothetical protein